MQQVDLVVQVMLVESVVDEVAVGHEITHTADQVHAVQAVVVVVVAVRVVHRDAVRVLNGRQRVGGRAAGAAVHVYGARGAVRMAVHAVVLTVAVRVLRMERLGEMVQVVVRRDRVLQVVAASGAVRAGAQVVAGVRAVAVAAVVIAHVQQSGHRIFDGRTARTVHTIH